MVDDYQKRKVITPKFRASFVKVWKPEAFEEGQDAKYSITMMFPEGTDLSGLKSAAKAAKDDKWGNKPPKKLVTPFKDGNEMDREECEDMIVVRASSKHQPGIVGLDPRVPITDETVFYSGCWARASLQAFAYDYKGMKKGVSFALNNVQKLRDDEAFSGGGSKAEDDFDDDTSERSEPNEFEDDDFDF